MTESKNDERRLKGSAGVDSIESAKERFVVRHFRTIIISVAAIVCCFQLVRIVTSPTGDFELHHELGRRMLAGELIYQPRPGGDPRGHDYPYPPFWGFVHVPFSLVQFQLAQALCFPVFVVSLIGLLGILRHSIKLAAGLDPDHLFWMLTLIVVASSRFLVRDMLECGVNLGLVTLSWLSLFLWRRGRDYSAGGVLGLAIALKCTPALFAIYFLFKRQWRIVGSTLAAALVFTVSPIVLMGSQAYSAAMSEWVRNAFLAGVVQADGVHGVLGEEPLQNMSLKPAAARFLTSLPDGHLSRLDDPLYFDFLRLPARLAAQITLAFMGGLALCVAWRFRRPVVDRQSPEVLWEAAVISLAILLYSPITWGQHCVGVLPVVALLVLTSDSRCVGREVTVPGLQRAAFWFFIVSTVILNRGLFGRRLALLFDSYHLQTFAILGLMLAALDCHRRLVSRDSKDKHDAAGHAASVRSSELTAARAA